MTENQQFEFAILCLANEFGKFALEVGHTGDKDFQLALERLQIRRWVMLIDVSQISIHRDKLFRLFMISQEAYEWRTEMSL